MTEFTTPEVQVLRTLPTILGPEDLRSVLRISKSSLYNILRDLNAWKDEDGEWNVLREDLITYVERNTEAGCS